MKTYTAIAYINFELDNIIQTPDSTKLRQAIFSDDDSLDASDIVHWDIYYCEATKLDDAINRDNFVGTITRPR